MLSHRFSTPSPEQPERRWGHRGVRLTHVHSYLRIVLVHTLLNLVIVGRTYFQQHENQPHVFGEGIDAVSPQMQDIEHHSSKRCRKREPWKPKAATRARRKRAWKQEHMGKVFVTKPTRAEPLAIQRAWYSGEIHSVPPTWWVQQWVHCPFSKSLWSCQGCLYSAVHGLVIMKSSAVYKAFY